MNKQARILIIEDDDKLRFNLERMVRSLGQKLLGSFSDAAASRQLA